MRSIQIFRNISSTNLKLDNFDPADQILCFLDRIFSQRERSVEDHSGADRVEFALPFGDNYGDKNG